MMEALTDLRMPVAIYRKPDRGRGQDPFRRGRRPTARTMPNSRTRCWRILEFGRREVLGRFRCATMERRARSTSSGGLPISAVTRVFPVGLRHRIWRIPNLPDRVTRDAYSHEVSSAGFWPGGCGGTVSRSIYSYAYPEPPGFADAKVEPSFARLRPDDCANLCSGTTICAQRAIPEQTLFAFLQSTYVAAAELGAWDRRARRGLAADAQVHQIATFAERRLSGRCA
jgi:hypothetical protein